MAVYEVQLEDGSTYEIETEDAPQPEKGLARKGWDALAVPEQKSREGLKMIADAVPSAEPTGNVVRDVALNTPKVLADTVAEVAPSFIDRNAIVTSGLLEGANAARPLTRAAGRAVAKGAEAISGLEYKTPGILREAFSDPTLISAPGKKAAGELYGATDDAIRQQLKEISNPLDQVEKALEFAKDGSLNPKEALEARKSLDASRKKVSGSFYRYARETLDTIAKQETKMADAAYARGVKADALRNPLPQNKFGGTSVAKSLGGFFTGLIPMASMSPLVQGTLATALGMGSRAIAPLLQTGLESGALTGAGLSAIQRLLQAGNQRAENR